MNVRFGRYTAVEELGRGNNGVVVRAHAPDGVDVAIKVLKTHRRDDPEDVERFLREAAIAARLDHPHIVRLLDSGDSHHGPYQVVELIDGPDLRRRVRDEGPLPPAEAARITRDLARGLEHAHRAGVVHRDVKPENVLIDAEGRARLTDFGLGRLLDPFRDRMTRSGDLLGTPVYMAPEQALGSRHEVGPHSDIYALGGTLYFMLTGAPPVDGRSIEEVLLKAVGSTPAPPSALREAIDPRLDAICLRCLAKDPAERYVSAGALADDLDAYLAPPARRSRAARAALVATGLCLPLVVAAAYVARGAREPAAADLDPPPTAASTAPTPTGAPAPTEAVRPDPLAEALARVESAIRRQNPTRAAAALRAARAIDDRDPRARVAAFRLHELRRDRPAAFGALQEALDLGGAEVVARALRERFPDPVLRRLARVTYLEREGSLDEAALRCSQAVFDPDLDVARWIRYLDDAARRARAHLGAARGRARLERLVGWVREHLVAPQRQQHFVRLEARRFEQALATRRGIHITCALALLAIARRLEVPLQGVCFPKWLQVRAPGPPPLVIDAYRGLLFELDEVPGMFRAMLNRDEAARGAVYRPSMTEPSPRRDLVLRHLVQLESVLILRRDRAGLRAVRRVLKTLFPYDLARASARAQGWTR